MLETKFLRLRTPVAAQLFNLQLNRQAQVRTADIHPGSAQSPHRHARNTLTRKRGPSFQNQSRASNGQFYDNSHYLRDDERRFCCGDCNVY
jgi:hypothetical protein